MILNKKGCLKTKSELSGELVTTFQMVTPKLDFQYLLRFQRNSLRNFDYDFREYPPFSEATKVENKHSVMHVLLKIETIQRVNKWFTAAW